MKNTRSKAGALKIGRACLARDGLLDLVACQQENRTAVNAERVGVTMNKKQMLVLWGGIILIVIMGLFPPCFKFTYRGSPVCPEYCSIFAPPALGQLDISRLTVQWLLVCFVTGGLIASLSGRANPMDPRTEIDHQTGSPVQPTVPPVEPVSKEPTPYRPKPERPDYLAALKAVPAGVWREKLPMISTPSIDREDPQQSSAKHE